MANNDKENKIKKFTKEAIGKTLNQFNKEIGIADLVEINKNQDRILNGILSQVNDENTEKTEKSNIITLDNSTDGIVELKEIQGDTNVNVSKIEEMPITHDIGDKEGNVISLDNITEGAINIDNIQGNTMVNCNKDDKKELVLMKDLSTQGDNNITLTEGVDGGKVDVALEGNTLVNVSKTKNNYITHEREEDITGNHIALADEGYIRPMLTGKTMVNVCDQKDPVAITKSYTVETGNHVALQGEYDGKCRPVVTGNTLVNLCTNLPNDFNLQNNDGTEQRRYIIGTSYNLIAGNTYTLIITFKNVVNDNNYDYLFRCNDDSTGTAYKLSDGVHKIVFTMGDGSTIDAFDIKIPLVSITAGARGTVSNPIILEGDYTDKPIPDYFEGLQSSFEDRLVPENINENSLWIRRDAENMPRWQLNAERLSSTKKTLYNGSNKKIQIEVNSDIQGVQGTWLSVFPLNPGEVKLLNTPLLRTLQLLDSDGWGTTLDLTGIYLIDGDYTKYDFSDYDTTKAGKYKVDYKVTGKNKFNFNSYNILNNKNNDIVIDIGTQSITMQRTDSSNYEEIEFNVNLLASKKYALSYTYETLTDNNAPIRRFKFVYEDGTYRSFNHRTATFENINEHKRIVKISIFMQEIESDKIKMSNIQIEEDTATSYESYKESTKTLYLNSPLLEGDTIEQYGNNIAHVHRYGKTVFDGSEAWNNSDNNYAYVLLNHLGAKASGKLICDKLIPGSSLSGDIFIGTVGLGIHYNDTDRTNLATLLSWLQSNPTTVVYELASPRYEVVSTNDKLLTDSYVNGHLDFESAVPVEKVTFDNTRLSLKYQYPNTEYTIQFESNNQGKIYVMYSSGDNISNQDVVKGINKFNFTTNASPYPNILINGIGFNASNIVVTPAIEQDFDYFSGLSSAFENNLVPENILGEKVKNTAYKVEYSLTKNIKPNTTYTIYLKGSNMLYCGFQKDSNWVKYRTPYQGVNIITTDDNVDINKFSIHAVSNNLTVDTCILIEGDYSSFGLTNYEPTKVGKYKIDYNVVGKNKIGNLTHLRSWQADYELLSDGGIKVTPTTTSGVSFVVFRSDSKVYKGKTYRFNGNPTNKSMYYQGGLWKTNTTSWVYSGTNPIDETQSFDVCIYVNNSSLTNEVIVYPQLEEGTKTTSYEPYKEYTKTLYLNSPLLEGDTIEEKDGGIYHVHRRSKVVLDGNSTIRKETDGNNVYRFITPIGDIEQSYITPLYSDNFKSNSTCLGVDYEVIASSNTHIYFGISKNRLLDNTVGSFKQWLQQNPTTIVYELLTPQYELIEQSNLAIPSYANGHLDLPSAVPVSKVNFLHFEEELVYLYPSTSYTIQFMSDKAITIDITLGGTQLLSQNIVKELNRISITTPETLANNKLIIDGVGASISNVVVTDTDREFKYFEGMKSVGECEELEVVSCNKNLFDSELVKGYWYNGTFRPSENAVANKNNVNVQSNTTYSFYISDYTDNIYIAELDKDFNEIKSHTIKSGNYITTSISCKYLRFCTDKTIQLSTNANIQIEEGETATDYIPHQSNTQTLTHEPLRAVGDIKDKYVLIDDKWYIERKCGVRAYQDGDIDNYITDMINTVYPLSIPVYEPIDYNPFEVYSEVTHITINSTIPTNITVKNHGFNCLLKPSTTYTISSNLGLNTVTTPSVLTEDCLRFYDTDTSDVTTMKNVTILEGDYTTGKPIPSHFSGIESCFEQEYDEEKGKYKVKAKVVGKNLFDGNFISAYVGGDNINTFVESSGKRTAILKIKPNTTYTISKTGGNRFGIATHYEYPTNGNCVTSLYNNNDGTNFTFTSDFTKLYLIVYVDNNSTDNIKLQIEEGTESTPYEPYKESIIEFYIDEPLRGIGDVKDKIYVKDDKVVVERNCDEVVLDGSENWYFYSKNEKTIEFGTGKIRDRLIKKASGIYSDIYSNQLCSGGSNCETIKYNGNPDVLVAIYKAKLNSYDKESIKQYLQQNPITVVYQLEEPVYEEVEYSSNRLILNTFNNESFNNSTLFLDTNISPKLSFKPLYEELVYVKNSTKYYIQFNAVGSGEVVINLGGTELTTEIVEGYNCIPITTPSESTNLMTIIGQGITISEVVVSEVICGGYYKGLQSCFEEHMENGKYRVLLRGIALDGSKVNGIKLYINEPLRGVGDAKDRLCIKDDKLMVERNCGSATFDSSNDEEWRYIADYGRASRFDITINDLKPNTRLSLLCNKFANIAISTPDIEGIGVHYSENYLQIQTLHANSYGAFKQWLKQNPISVVYQLVTPTYEEAINEYGYPIVLEGYENGIVYIDSAVTPTTSIKYTSNNQLATTLSEAEEQNNSTQDDINMNVVTYMMDIDMILTEMEMSNDISVMAVRRDSSNENMLDRMSDEDKKVYRDNTVVMLEKMITANVLEKEDIERRINMYYDKNRISKEQYKYLKSLL